MIKVIKHKITKYFRKLRIPKLLSYLLENSFNKKSIFVERKSHAAFLSNTVHPVPGYLYASTDLYSTRAHLVNRLPYLNKSGANSNMEIRKDLNYILEIEHILMATNSTAYNYALMLSRVEQLKEHLRLDACKGIIALSKKTMNTALEYLGEEFKGKISYIYPSIDKSIISIDQSKYDEDCITVLHVGNGFLGKGTHVVIEVAKLLLTNKLIKFIIVSASLPKEVRLPSNVELVSTQYMSKTQRNEIYLKSDLMLFPVFQDSFGVYLEAISYGMPILSNNIYDKNELVENGVTGYLIDTPISLWDGNVGVDYKNWSEFQELILKFNGTSKFRQMIESYVEKLLYLEKNRSVYKKMSIDTSNLCIDRFSPSKRTLKLSHLYNALD